MSETVSKEKTEKLIPQSIEAEQVVLGALLIDPAAILKITSKLKPESFYKQSHKQIFSAILHLFNNNEPIDVLSISEYLKSIEKLDMVGGRAYINDLALAVITSANIEYYARIVAEKAVLRELIKAGGEIASVGYEDLPADKAIDSAEQIIFNISQRKSAENLAHVGSIVVDSYDLIEKRWKNKDELIGVPSGFYDLDNMTSGFQKSDLIIVAARPSMGKTAFCLNIAQEIGIRRKRPVAIFSLEMSKEQLVQRMLCSEAEIDAQRVRSGNMQSDDWPKLTNAMHEMGDSPIFIDDTAGVSVMDVRAKCRRLSMEQKDLGLVIIDYLQLMEGTDRKQDRVQEISSISRGLKNLARELKVPIIALSQLSRAVEQRQNKLPMLSDLRESGCLTGESLVYLPDEGVYKRIDELTGKEGFNVLALNTETWQLEKKRVLSAFSTGIKPVFKMTTRLGKIIRATANHKFLSISGWQRLDALSPKMRIALPRQIPSAEQGSMSQAQLALLGHMIGDGCSLPRHCIQYTTNDISLAETVSKLALEIFGDKIAPRINNERKWYQVYLTANEHLTHGKRNPVAEWLDELEIFGLRSHEKFIPRKVFSQPLEYIAVFLRHLWATDGCINLKHYANIYYASSSYKLAQGVQSLLLRFGINAKLAKVPQGNKGRDQYHVTISGKEDIEQFLSCIGSLGEQKVIHHQKIQEYLSTRSSNTNRDVLPFQIWREMVVPAMQVIGMTTREMQAALGQQYCGTSLYKNGISRERALRLAEVVQCSQLAQLAKSDVYWDEIISIEPDGYEEVYDLTVDELHNFIANDIVVHNSIEQDADIVMFIYRDEYYNPESEDKGKAKIIIAKQRNGPVGDLDLLFQKNITKFKNPVKNRTNLF